MLATAGHGQVFGTSWHGRPAVTQTEGILVANTDDRRVRAAWTPSTASTNSSHFLGGLPEGFRFQGPLWIIGTRVECIPASPLAPALHGTPCLCSLHACRCSLPARRSTCLRRAACRARWRRRCAAVHGGAWQRAGWVQWDSGWQTCRCRD